VRAPTRQEGAGPSTGGGAAAAGGFKRNAAGRAFRHRHPELLKGFFGHREVGDPLTLQTFQLVDQSVEPALHVVDSRAI